MPHNAEVAVIGAGPVGLATALALGQSGIPVTVAAPPYDVMRAASDRRTTALIGPSIEFLKNLDVWRHCAGHAAPIGAVRIADDRGTIVRVPEILFSACELGLESFGSNAPNAALLEGFEAAAAANPQLTRIATSAVTRLEPNNSGVRIHLAEGGCIAARLVVAADGRNSIGPAAAGITVRSWSYQQAAIVTNFAHTRPHGGVVNELHRRSGPLTTVPLPDCFSSLVWVVESAEAQAIAGLSDDTFAEHLEDRLQGVLGKVHDAGPRLIYPLSGASTARMAARRIALVGEAAHVIPPIGAQGLNLGLKDAAALAESAANARSLRQDIGGAQMLDAYHVMRMSDVASRSTAIDLLNRSLLADFLPIDLLKGVAVHALASSGALRRLLMQSGLGTTGALPRLMRPNASCATT